MSREAVCDGTQNVKRYQYQYFFRYQIFLIAIPVLFRYQIFPIPIPRLFPISNLIDTGSETFFRYQIFPIPVSVPPKFKIPDTGTFTIPVSVINLQNSYIFATKISSGTKFFRYRFRSFFRYQIFPVPVPILFSSIKLFRYLFTKLFPVPIFLILVPILPKK